MSESGWEKNFPAEDLCRCNKSRQRSLSTENT